MLICWIAIVEAGILYTAVFEGKSTIAWNPELLSSLPDITDSLTKLPDELDGIIFTYDTAGTGMKLYYDMGEERLLILKKE